MTATARKTESTAIAVATPKGGTVIAMNRRPVSVLSFRKIAASIARNVVPPLVVLIILLGLWQALCSAPGSSLPPPSQVFEESYDLIVHPFFHYGSQDIGLGWRVLVSLERVAYGLVLRRSSASLSAPSSASPSGRCVASIRSFRCCAPSRRSHGTAVFGCVPGQQSFGHFRDLHHLHLAGHHQYRGRRAQHPQDYRNVAQVLRLNQIEFFYKIMLPSAAPYIFTGLRIGVGLSWLAIVAAEMLTGGVGIGFFIWDAWNSSRLPDIIVALAYIGVVGFVLDKLVAAAGKLITRGAAAN